MDLREIIDTYLPDKAALYEMLIRHRYFLPSEGSTICSVKFLDGVFKQTIYCPKMHEVHPIRIASSPPKKMLQDELIRILEAKVMGPEQMAGYSLIQHLQRKTVDKHWIVCMLYMVCSDHPIFEADY